VAANFSNLDGMRVNIKILGLIILFHSGHCTPIDRIEDFNAKINYFYIDYFTEKIRNVFRKSIEISI